MKRSSSHCKTCGMPIMWVEKPTGGWHRPVEPVEETGYLVISLDGRLQEARDLFQVHVCDPAMAERHAKTREQQLERERLFKEAVESIDCPHPRCNGVAGGPCKSLKDGETDLLSHHDQRRKEAGKQGLLPPLVRETYESS